MAISSSSSSSTAPSLVSLPTPSMPPLLTSNPSSTPDSARKNAFIVEFAISLLWVVFRSLDCCLSLLDFAWKKFAFLNRRRRTLTRTTKTVVIVGGNFAGLSALSQLLAWQRKHCHNDDKSDGDGDDLRIILIDKREYSEYTPGILRLFCDPGHFWSLAQSLPENNDHCTGFERILGTVTSIVSEDPGYVSCDPVAPTRRRNNVLTYVPDATSGKNDNNSFNNHNTQMVTSTRNIVYDYLIIATGATYNEPISPATPKTAGRTIESTATMPGRYQEWKNAHDRLKAARRVLILGGGPVGVELAAEILDHYTDGKKTVTIVDAQQTLVPLFPRSVGAYAKDWLSRKGADLRLGKSLRSWNDCSCTLVDGTVLHADLVYVCFGNRPNSEMVAVSSAETAATAGGEKKKTGSSSSQSKFFSLTRRRNVVVKDTLQLAINNDTDGNDDGDSDSFWFACGDVAGPPTNDEKQAFQAEMQGKIAARNVIAMLESCQGTNTHKTRLFRYPQDIAGADRIPLVYVLSLGKHDGVLGFNSMCISGPVAAIAKWILEHTKVSQMRGRLIGNIIWKIGDAATLFLSRTLFRSSPSTSVTTGLTTKTNISAGNSYYSTIISETTASSSSSVRQTTIAPHQRHRYHKLEEQLELS